MLENKASGGVVVVKNAGLFRGGRASDSPVGLQRVSSWLAVVETGL